MTAPPPDQGTIHPVLAAAFGVLEAKGIRWALLRDPSRPEAPTGDVDVLVHPGDAPALASLLRPLGFVPLPWRATGPELTFLGFHRPTCAWLVLDVVTEMSFGRDLCFRAADADVVLPGSQAEGSVRRLAPDDRFWALLLHCLLEKDSTSQPHRRTLAQWAGSARADGALGRVVDSCCPKGWGAQDLIEAVRGEQWDGLDKLRQPLRKAWRLARPTDVARAHALQVRRLLRGPVTVLERRGVAVVLVGPNGAGKSTVARELLATYPAPARLTYFGLWKQAGPLGPVHAGVRVLSRPLVVWGRYGRTLADRVAGRLVIFDRYVYDALLPPQPPLVALKRPYLWFLAHSCPPPTVTIVLDVPGEVAWRRKRENSVDELERERSHLRGLADGRRRVHLIDATRPLRDVVGDVTAVVWGCYVDRWTRPDAARRRRGTLRSPARARRPEPSDAAHSRR